MILRASAVLFCAAACLHGQPAPRRLSLDQALQLAEHNHPQLESALAERELSSAAVLTARAYPNPEAGYLAGHQRPRLLGAIPGLNQVYSVSQPLETRAVRDTRLRAATLGRDSSDFAVTYTRLLLRANVKQAFYLYLRRQAEIELTRGNVDLVDDLRRRIEAQVRAGEAPKLELTRAEAELALARTALRSAELRKATAAAALHAALGEALPEGTEPAGDLPSLPALPSAPDLISATLARHPLLLQAQAEIRRAQAALDSQLAQRTPQPTLRGEYEQQPDVATYRLGFSLPVPLWNKRQGPVAEAVAALRRTRSEANARRLELTAALEAALGRFELARQQIDSLEQGVLKPAEAALRAAEAAHRFGERGILEVLDAQRLLRSTRLDLLNAHYDRQAAAIDLEQLGALPLSNPAEHSQEGPAR